MIITEIQYFFSKIIRFQAIFKDTVEFTCALEFKISSQPTNDSFCPLSQPCGALQCIINMCTHILSADLVQKTALLHDVHGLFPYMGQNDLDIFLLAVCI